MKMSDATAARYAASLGPGDDVGRLSYLLTDIAEEMTGDEFRAFAAGEAHGVVTAARAAVGVEAGAPAKDADEMIAAAIAHGQETQEINAIADLRVLVGLGIDRIKELKATPGLESRDLRGPRLRGLPRSNYPTGNLVVPGLGEFSFQPVGDTTYSKAVHVYFQHEGALEAEGVFMSFSLAVTDDFEFEWGHALGSRTGRKVEKEPPAEVIDAAYAHLERMHLDASTNFLFQALGAIGPELDNYRHTLRSYQDSVALYEKSTPEEDFPAEKIAELLAKYRLKLEAHNALSDGPDSRIARLKEARAVMKRWSSAPSKAEGNIRDLVEAALKPEAVAAPAM